MEHRGSRKADSLSSRERELVVLASQGLTDVLIGQKLGIGLPTVGTYWTRIRSKFGSASRTEAVAMFLHEQSAHALESLMAENSKLLASLDARAKAEEALKSTLDLFRGLVDTSQDGIVLVNEAGQIVLSNPQAEQMFGYEAGEMTGMSVEFLVPLRNRQGHSAHRLDYTNKPVERKMGNQLATYAVRKDGSEFPIATMLRGVATQSGLIVTCIIRDLTDTLQRFVG